MTRCRSWGHTHLQGLGTLRSDRSCALASPVGPAPWGHPAHLPPGTESSARWFPEAPCPVLGVPASLGQRQPHAPCPPPGGGRGKAPRQLAGPQLQVK